ncbi:MAG: M15 family metallopeptidase [Luteolibacter sp.]
MPKAQEIAREWLSLCRAEGIHVKVISGHRSFEEQADLYAKGRTKAGQKVTNAKPGHSWHNFGVAWDFVVFDDADQPLWNSPFMTRCGEIGEALGLEWGGRWKKLKDTPHLQLMTGITLAEARKRRKAGLPIL